MTNSFDDPIGFGKILECGYKQKGNKYFLNFTGPLKLPLTNFDVGFNSKKQIEEWLNDNPYGYVVKNRMGYLIMFKGQTHYVNFVNRHNLAI